MKHTREQKRTEWLAAAQAVIEEFLDWEEQTARPKLTEIEDQVLPLRRALGNGWPRWRWPIRTANSRWWRQHAASVVPGCVTKGRKG